MEWSAGTKIPGRTGVDIGKLFVDRKSITLVGMIDNDEAVEPSANFRLVYVVIPVQDKLLMTLVALT